MKDERLNSYDYDKLERLLPLFFVVINMATVALANQR